MNVYESYAALKEEDRGGVVVIGNFDGVHRGHQYLLEQAREKAQALNVPVVVLTFDPHPRQLFRPDDPPARLTMKALKLERLGVCGFIDAVVSLDFDWTLASMSATDFIEEILNQGLRAKAVVVGDEFRFGQMRSGTPEMISAAGMETIAVTPFNAGRVEKISSSDIRQCLRHGKIAKANELLGWEWYLSGAVIKGDQRGRELGFPTANIPLREVVHPAYGVYAARVQIEGEDIWRRAAINIGIKPMFEVPQADVEAHILDYSGDLYGKILKVQPVEFLRSEARFDGVEALIEQMHADCARAREILR